MISISTGQLMENHPEYSAEIAKASNKRYIAALENIIPVKSVQSEIQDICSHKTEKGKIFTGFNMWEKDTLQMF